MGRKGGFSMICPKCNEETIISVRFKTSGKHAYLCENCRTVWFEGENIKAGAGHLLDSLEDQVYGTTYERMVPEIKQIEERPLEENETEESE